MKNRKYEIMIKRKQYYDLKLINENIRNDLRKQVLDTESRYRGQLFAIADRIIAEKDIKMILMAGPSCAGKTTTARLLKEILEKTGKDVITISMDDFFIDRDLTPLLPNGQKDFDSPRALNLDLMKECFSSLVSGKKTWVPRYDFMSGKNINKDRVLQAKYNSVIIFEGLHVLNPLIIKSLGTDKYFGIYVNALTGFKYGKEKVSALELRLMRRLIRDIARRSFGIHKNLVVWQAVCDAEKKYIAKFRKNAHAVVDTTHEFELGVLKAERNIIEVLKGKNFHKIKALKFMEHAECVDKTALPNTTLMWEFVEPPKVEEEEKKEKKSKQKKDK
ncbi:MAG: hypothetical protein E7361_04090 [Clostridiales bacterium]|nr:hypothetical protein [Clostridiales bacterium]